MKHRALIAVFVSSLALATPTRHIALPVATANRNITRAGTLRDGVLNVDLIATLAMWHPDGDSRPGIPIEVFAEAGKAPTAPGPMIRVPLGTALRIAVQNSLARDTITYSVDVGDAHDSIVVAPSGSGTLIVRPAKAGTFFYRATTSTPLATSLGVGGLMAGAVVIDSTNTTPNDRVFVLQGATDAQLGNIGVPFYPRTVWAMNGRAWPNTERLDATVGDTVHWRVINIGKDAHPMHLHGFYFSVDAVDGASGALRTMEPPTARVVTARVGRFSAITMTWIPERPGNWLFHCHFAEHVVPHGVLSGESPGPDVARIGEWPGRMLHPDDNNHANTSMAGLITGIVVKERPGTRAAVEPATRRTLRIVATQDAGFADSEPSLRYVLANAGQPRIEARPGMSVPLSLTRGEPVAITVVNATMEATSVHWHGIEVDSYADGVAGFSGSGTRLSPLIAPGDSFVARFTPPRAGTFMYHSHVDELRQQRAGFIGPLIVREPAADSSHDVVFLFKIARAHPSPIRGVVSPPFEINGQRDPDTLRLRVGEVYRVRLIALQSEYPAVEATLTARADSSFTRPTDDQSEQWTPLAKDGADFPSSRKVVRNARQLLSMGETYDFEFTPQRVGLLRLELRVGVRLAARTPIRVESR